MFSVTRGDVILVTGATGAIGFEIAAQAAAACAVVGVHGSALDSVARAMDRLRERAPDARPIAAPADFRVEGSIEAMVAAVVATGGRLDAVVHCGITGADGVTGPFQQTYPAKFAQHAAMILGNFQLLCFAALPHLALRGGTIVGFASDAGRFAAPRR